MSSADPTAQGLLAQCKEIAVDRRATTATIIEAVQTAYEIGLAEGKLRGKVELGEQLFPGAIEALV